MVRELKKEFGERSDTTYTVLSKLSPFLSKKSVTDIQKCLGVNFDNAKKIKNGEKLGRKVYDKIINEEVVNKIVQFYEFDTISRIDMRKNKTSKKWGPRRYMYTTIRMAHLNFITDNPEMKVSFSSFHKLRPRNVKVRKHTPLISSLCPYCHNIRLILQKANVLLNDRAS